MHTSKQLAKQILPDLVPVLDYIELAKQQTSHYPAVLVYGVYNSGKSSLLNSLTEHLEQEHFKTNNIPETKACNELDYDGIHYIDTPGLDVNQADTQAANQGVLHSDIVLLVHKLSAGSIQLADLTSMKQAVAHHKQSRIAFVITEAEIADSNRALISEIKQQVQRHFSATTPVFLVSNTRYKKNSDTFKQASGILELKAYLHHTAQQVAHNLEKERTEKIQAYKQLALQMVAQKSQNVEKQLFEQKRKAQNNKVAFIGAVSQLQQQCKQFIQQISSVH